MERIKFIEVASELGAGTRGASLGIGALKAASLAKGSDFFKRYPCMAVPTLNEQLFEDILHPYAKRIPQVRQILEYTYDAVKNTLQEGCFPVVLAGDHSTAAGTIAGIKAAMPQKRLGVIWIDAHADLHTPFTTPSGNMHGMPLSMVAGIDNKECQVNEPQAETVEEWSRIKNIGIAGAKIDPSDIVFIGMRSREEPEKAIISRHGIRNFSVEELRSKGVASVVHETMNLLADCSAVYISFDVDSLDPEISAGTGTPVPQGLTVEEARELNHSLISQEKVVCWEMVEINPTLDVLNKMAKTAFEILEIAVTARSSNGKLIDA
ncbi:arginase [Cesiribacter sp. SM1]|uniref:arginase n=1 Tax=Cesiribacter sp. SM1 TaxID=2861196 RepID=UPI001CD5CF48|nr:arginase [Cesiribacter sp. SM1]